MWPTHYLPTGPRGARRGRIIDWFDPVCVTYYADLSPAENLPRARAGDWLLVRVLHTENYSSSENIRIDHSSNFGASFTPSVAKDGTEWTTIWDSPDIGFSASARHMFDGLFIRQLTSGDVAAGRVFRFRGPSTVGIYCYQAVVLRDLYANIPVEMVDNTYNRSSAATTVQRRGVFGPTGKVNAPGSILLQLGYYQGGTGHLWRGDGYEAGPEPTLDWAKRLASKHWWIGLREITEGEEQNLIEGETVDSTLTNWTSINVTKDVGAGSYFKYTRLYRGAGASARNHAARTVELVAGQQYTYAVLTSGASNNYNYPFISVVLPDASEIGGIYQYTDGPSFGLYSTTGIIGTGHDTYWHLRALVEDSDGLPSHWSGWAIMHFTAPETGTYELRYGFANGGVAPTNLTHGAEGEVRCRRALLMTGYKQPLFTPTEDGVVDGAFGNGQVHTRWWTAPAGKWGNATQFVDRFGAACLNPDNDSLLPARLVPFEDEYASASGLGISGGTLADGDGGSPTLVSRTVYPKIDGTAQRYYFEVTVTQFIAGSPSASIAIGAINAQWQDSDQNLGMGTYRYACNGDVYRESTRAYNGPNWSPGTVIGVEIDYASEVIRFYRNGTLQGSALPMVDNTNYRQKLLPAQAVIYWGTSNGAALTGFTGTVNLRGPFLHKPVGCVAWDWPFEAV